MNEAHRVVCASVEWGEFLRTVVLPTALAGVDLGEDVLEIGPGPGLTTDVIRDAVQTLTAVELDADLAAALRARLTGTNVEVITASGTELPLPSDRFSAAVSFTMLHHVPTTELQDDIFSELARVIAPGGIAVFSDSVGSDALCDFHADDTYNPIDPSTLVTRLRAAGFTDVTVDADDQRFVARARV